MKDRALGSLTFEEVSHLGARSVLVLPVGSMEQHGPHLPLDTDAILAERIAHAITARFGEAFDLWQLPILPLGLSREHAWTAGTLSLSVTGMTTFLRELAREIARALPARNLMIVNGHGGNRGILEVLGYELTADFGLNVCALHTGALMSPVPAVGMPEIHAGKDETSLMLALAPDRVRRERIGGPARSVDDAKVRATILDPGVSWPWSSGDPRIADHGVIGDASGASVEHGRVILDRILEAAGAALQRLLDNQDLAPTT
ncbi:MAG: creatininase family protein [Reyranella sp.]|uniref:creatininase family protein n=1 Tax=Reyranella sp. TaxID=1929291 RepID=UPI003D0FCDFB